MKANKLARFILRIAVLLILIASISIPGIAVSQDEKKVLLNCTPATTPGDQTREQSAIEASQKLFDAFRDEYWSYIEEKQITPPDTYLVSSLPGEAYPSYYAGAYINQNHDLVIMLTDTRKSTINKIDSTICAERVTYRKAQYSYSCLIECMDNLMQHFKNANDSIIRYAYIDDFSNRVIVGLIDSSDSTKQALTSIITDVGCIKCIVCEDPVQIKEESSYTHRTQFWGYHVSTSSLSEYSYAVTATRNNVPGFITAGHAAYTGETSYTNVGNQTYTIGACTASYNGVYTDSAFVQTNTGVNLQSSLPTFNGTLNLSTNIAIVVPGSTVYFTAFSTQHAFGTVITTSYMLTLGNDVYFADMIISNYGSTGGDSGGLVYTSNSTTAYPVAIHKGEISTGYLDGSGVNYSGYPGPYKICSKMSYALSALSATITN